MSYRSSSHFYPVNKFDYDFGLAMNQDSSTSTRRFLGDVSFYFDSSSFSSLDSTPVPSVGDYPHLFMDYKLSTGPVSHDSIEERPFGIFSSLPSEHPTLPEHFNGYISPQDTYLIDLKTLDDHGRAPHFSVFNAPEDSQPMSAKRGKQALSRSPVTQTRFECTKPGCNKTFARMVALERHMNKCTPASS